MNNRRKSDPGHIHFAILGCVSAAGLQDPAANFPGASSDRQVLIVYLHHELFLHPGHCGDHQLELPRPSNPQDAKLDSGGLSQVFAPFSTHEEAQEDSFALDDGDASFGHSLPPTPSPSTLPSSSSTHCSATTTTSPLPPGQNSSPTLPSTTSSPTLKWLKCQTTSQIRLRALWCDPRISCRCTNCSSSSFAQL